MASRENGSLTLGMMIAIGLLTVALGVTAKWAQHEAGKRAEAEASMRQWQATALECSLATEKAAKAGQDAQDRAKKALATARKGSVAAQSELARLKASMGQKATCQAAVAKVREGLVR